MSISHGVVILASEPDAMLNIYENLIHFRKYSLIKYRSNKNATLDKISPDCGP